jgi:hypothetical protein
LDSGVKVSISLTQYGSLHPILWGARYVR